MTGSLTTFSGEGLTPVYDPEDAICQSVNIQPVSLSLVKGTVLGQVTAKTAQNEVQTLTAGGTVSGGTYIITFAGQQTTALAYNASNATIQAALEALSNIGTGNVAVGGGALPGTPATLTFQSALGNKAQPLVGIISSLTGTNPTLTPTRTTTGNPGYRYFAAYDDSKSDGTQVAKGLLQYAVSVAPNGMMTVGGGEFGEAALSAPAYFAGTFKTADLTGIDANGVADLGKQISGNTLTESDSVIRIG